MSRPLRLWLLLLGGVIYCGWAVRAEDPAPASAVRRAVSRGAPSVVRVEVSGKRPRGDAPRRHLFRQVQNRPGGAGFVVGTQLVVTHGSLAGRYEDPSFVVTTGRGSRYPARLRHLDLGWEVAILETASPLDVPALSLSPSAELEVGNLVVALGDPFGTARDAQPTASLGVVEGRGRVVAREVSAPGPLLLTSAAINPGSEGGPLIDLSGRVVGVLAPLARDLRTRALSGHAVPSEAVQRVLRDAQGKNPPRLGFFAREDAQGVTVAGVHPDSPAERAGLKVGDRLQTVQGQQVRQTSQLRPLLDGLRGELVLEVERAGLTLTLRFVREEER